MKTVHRAYSIFVVLILVLGVFAFPAQAPSPVHAEDAAPAEPTQEPTQAPAEPPPAAPAVTAPDSFSWDLTINVTQEQVDALGSAEFDAFTKLTQNNVAYEIKDGTLKLSGTENLDQMRQAIFEDISPVVSFLGGQISLNITSPVQQAQAMTVNLETRPTTGFTWTLDPSGTSAILSQTGDSKTTQRTPGLAPSAYLSMDVASAEDGAAILAVRYNRPFEKEIVTYASLNINLPVFTPVVDITDPVVESAALSADETQVSPEENLEENPLDQLTGLTEPLPTSFDWRTYGVVPDVRNQAACGSCFAFGTVGVMESAIKIAGGPLPDLSEQFIVSCNKNNWNCDNGGLTAHAYHYNTLGKSQTVVGAVLESDFPYSATNGSCTVSFSHPYKLSAWKFITTTEFTMPTVDQIKAAIYAYGPITAGVCAGGGWSGYSGGVFSTDETSYCSGGTNHQIILTGWNDADQTWILRNSWGPGWGDGGYMHIKWNTSRVGEGTSWVKYGTGLVLAPAPALVSPVSGYISQSANVNFQWNSVGSGIKYQIQIDDASTFATPLESYIGAVDELTYASGVLPQGTLYWRVRSIKFDHPGAWSAARSFIVDLTAPAKPNLLNPANGAGVNTATPALSVSAVTGAKYYIFEWDTAPDFTNDPKKSDYRTTTSYTLTAAQALPFGKVYWRAQAKDAAGNESGWSDARWFNVTILKAPANGSYTTNTKPPFSWAAAAGALNYEIQVDDDPLFSSPEINELRPPSTSYTHPTALAFNKYYWRMRVNTAGGPGDWTPANLFTVSPPLLPAPVLDSPANASYTNVPQPHFYWNPVAGGGVTYELWVDRQSTFTAPVDVVISDLFGTSAIPPTALADGKYYWKVRAINYLGVPGTWSSVRYLTVDTIAPPLPVLSTPLNGAAVLTTVPTLAVKAVTGGKYYLFQWDDAPDFSPPLGESGLKTTTSYKLTTAQALKFGKVYWRAVSFDAAMNTAGATDSRWFDVTILKTPANGSYTTNTKPTFSWVAVPGAVLYQIEVDDDEDFGSLVLGLTRPPSTSYTHSVPLAYGKYYWRMMVYNAAGVWSVYTPANQFTVTPPLLPAPVLLSPASGTPTNDPTPLLSWNAVTSADHYEVWVDSQSGFTAPVDVIYTGLTSTSKELEAPLPDGVKYWKVRAVNYLDVPGAWSSARSFTVDTVAPPAPALSAPANFAPGIYFAPTFSWVAATGANAYMFEYDNNLDFGSPEYTSGTLTTRTILPTGMGVGTWYWHVKSRDAAGNWGSWSAYRTLEILPPAVKNGGFEAGGTNWYGYSAGYVTGFAHSGSNSGIIADPLSNYGGAWLGQSSVNMTYGLKYLHFWYHIESEDWCGYDQAGVFINTTLVKVYDLCYSRNTNGWAHQVIGLSGYAGQTINLEFDTLGDYTYWSDFYIDDVVISTSSATPANVMVASARTDMPSRTDLLAGTTMLQDEGNERSQMLKAQLMQSIMRSRMHYSQINRIQ